MESGESITLSEAARLYVGSLKAKDDHGEVQRELFRFLKWCGQDRALSEIHPPEVGEYADQMGGASVSHQAAKHLQVIRSFLSFAKKKGLIDKNLTQHIRIPKAKARNLSTHVRDAQDLVELTPGGHAKMLEDLEKLRGERAPLAVQIQKAAADKDVRENVPLEAAREQLGHVESRIRSIESTLKDAVVIDRARGQKSTKVKLGTRVSLKDLNTGREMSYALVYRTEANPLEGKISDVSPLGKALVSRWVGQEVEVETPRGTTRYRILKVS